MGYFDNIPHAMRERNQWMLSDRNKAPLAWDWGENQTYAGSKNRPDQWMSYSTAREIAEAEGLLLGYVPVADDPFTIIDLDFKEDKVYDADAAEVKRALLDGAYGSSYIETSLSGKGYHIVVKGKLPHDFNAQSAGIECYGNKGFVVMTGRMPEACAPVEPSEQQPVLQWLADKYHLAVKDAAALNEGLDWHLINNAPAAELALDDEFAQQMDSWANVEHINSWFAAPGEDESRVDVKVMQLFVKYTRDRKHPDEAAIRMFIRSPRAQFLGRKGQAWQSYLKFTLAAAKGFVAKDEKRAKDFDFSAGTHAMMQAYQAQIEASRAPSAATQAPEAASIGSSAPVNSGVAPGQQAPEQFKGFNWLRKSDLEKLPPLEWAVKGLFPTKGTGAIYGESGTGKTFVVIDMIAAIATGERWFGMRTQKLPVSVFALEGEGGLRGRVKAWELENKREYPNDVLFWDSATNGAFALRDGDPRSDENKTRLVQLCADLNASGRRGGVVVIDTLNQASDGADENSSRDMGELLRAMKLIQRETQSLVIVVHHATKSKENQSMRGHSSLYGAMDGIMEVVRNVHNEETGELIEGRRGWIAKKVKDGKDGYTRLFDMREHQIGFDEDGPIMSISIAPVPTEIIDEQTGEIHEIVNTGTLKAPSTGRGSGGGSAGGARRGNGGSGAPNRAGSGEAPAVTRPSNRPTYSNAERAGAADSEPRSAAQADENLLDRLPFKTAVRDALVMATTKTGGSGLPVEGVPSGKVPIPRKELVEHILAVLNPSCDPANPKLKNRINAAIAYAADSGKIGKVNSMGKQYFWLLE